MYEEYNLLNNYKNKACCRFSKYIKVKKGAMKKKIYTSIKLLRPTRRPFFKNWLNSVKLSDLTLLAASACPPSSSTYKVQSNDNGSYYHAESNSPSDATLWAGVGVQRTTSAVEYIMAFTLEYGTKFNTGSPGNFPWTGVTKYSCTIELWADDSTQILYACCTSGSCGTTVAGDIDIWPSVSPVHGAGYAYNVEFICNVQHYYIDRLHAPHNASTSVTLSCGVVPP